MKKLFSLFVLLCSSCASSAWVIDKSPTSGIIGYNDTSRGYNKLLELIPCPQNYIVVNNETKQQEYIYRTYETVAVNSYHQGSLGSYDLNQPSYRFSGNTQSFIDIPKDNVGVRTWKELTYRCPY